MLAAYAVLTFFYSGGAAVQPSFNTDLFGLPHAGVNYGFIALGMSGGSILSYIGAQALPLADRFYLTRVFRAYEGDTHFPEWDEAQWRLLSSESFASGANYPYPFAFETYERRRN